MIYKRASGQTILEVLIAFTLVILFLSGVVAIEIYALKNLEYAQNKSLATKLARQQLERARVVRDTAGIESLSICLSSCYINTYLTPVPISPTGTFGQSLTIVEASSYDCPLPEVTITPVPLLYKATAHVSWGEEIQVVPAPQVDLDTCLSDWR